MIESCSGRQALLLVHGLGGTRTDLGNLKRKLAADGRMTFDMVLPGHGSTPVDLLDINCEEWIDAVNEKISELRSAFDTVHLVGMCMGALLALEAAKRGRLGGNGTDRLVLLAPPVFLDGWSLPWYRGLRHLAYLVPFLERSFKVYESFPFGIKNTRIRKLVERKLFSDERYHYPWVPLRSIRELDRLRRRALVNIASVDCPTLIVHSVDDELTSVRSAQYLRDRINDGKDVPQAKLRILSDSYHMICLDNERGQVALHVNDFLSVINPQ